MSHTNFRADIAAPLQFQVARFASPLTRMLLVGNGGNGLTTPTLEAALGATLRARGLRQDNSSVEQIPEADWR
jgi:hypothetical protein